MLRRRLPLILLVATSVIVGVAIAGPPNTSRTPPITAPVTTDPGFFGTHAATTTTTVP